mmetsp:Transcript_42942/g.102754  ORF Transcript_42942/g.102754 Transcript_42942/m.102754 type:complete len:195 (+) Transcript_42942:313-897(+)
MQSFSEGTTSGVVDSRAGFGLGDSRGVSARPRDSSLAQPSSGDVRTRESDVEGSGECARAGPGVVGASPPRLVELRQRLQGLKLREDCLGRGGSPSLPESVALEAGAVEAGPFQAASPLEASPGEAAAAASASGCSREWGRRPSCHGEDDIGRPRLPSLGACEAEAQRPLGVAEVLRERDERPPTFTSQSRPRP